MGSEVGRRPFLSLRVPLAERSGGGVWRQRLRKGPKCKALIDNISMLSGQRADIKQFDISKNKMGLQALAFAIVILCHLLGS